MVSVVVPAHNEAALLERGLRAIATAAAAIAPDHEVEVVVVDNRSTDETAAIAVAAGAAVVPSSARNISAVRNAGCAAAHGEVLVTIDADCVMHPGALSAVVGRLASGRWVGGGTLVRPERSSAGIRATYGLVAVVTAVTGLSGGMFWCQRRDFEEIGGFDEALLVGEDLGFARRLRAHGRATGRRLAMIKEAPVTASCRKFDRYGDWHMFAMAKDLRQIRASATGRDTRWVDRYFFDFND